MRYSKARYSKATGSTLLGRVMRLTGLMILAGCGGGDDSSADNTGPETLSSDPSSMMPAPAGPATPPSSGAAPANTPTPAANEAAPAANETPAAGAADEALPPEVAPESSGNAPDSETPEAASGTAVVSFAEIQLDLENADGSRGSQPSCTNGSNCHQNPARNVVIVPNPTPEQLRQNWESIVNVPAGVTPWVTPRDESAQMLNEIRVQGEIRERWLAWITAGAPFEAPR